MKSKGKNEESMKKSNEKDNKTIKERKESKELIPVKEKENIKKKMKTRLTSTEVGVLVKEFQSLISYRIVNIYELTHHRKYLIKLGGKSNLESKEKKEEEEEEEEIRNKGTTIAGIGEKTFLLVDSGSFIYTTTYDYPREEQGSHFLTLLRKHLKGKRITKLVQKGTDRIIEITVGEKTYESKLVLEFYSGGNMIVIESSEIVAILRTVNTTTIDMRIGSSYNVESKEVTIESIRNPIGLLKGEQGSFYDVLPIESENDLSFDFPYKVFPSFNTALDAYCYQLDSKKREEKKINKEDVFTRKIQGLENELRNRINHYHTEEDRLKEMAVALETNLNSVTDIQNILNSSTLNSESFMEYVLEEQSNGNPLALLIKSVDPNKVILILNDLEIPFDYKTSVYSNITKLYDQARLMVYKANTAESKVGPVLKQASIKIRKELGLKDSIINNSIDSSLDTSFNGTVKIRNPFWFEKYFWFISSEGFLVLIGRNAQQNEQLVKRVMRNDDVFCHADIQGGATVIIKANPRVRGVNGSDILNSNNSTTTANHTANPLSLFPPSTLTQALSAAVIYSRAWDTKLLVKAYWVFGHQVSQSPPSGEYLSTGSFIIRGKKNFMSLPMTSLHYGIAFLFYHDQNVLSHEDPSFETNTVVHYVNPSSDLNISASFDDNDEITIVENLIEESSKKSLKSQKKRGKVENHNSCDINQNSSSVDPSIMKSASKRTQNRKLKKLEKYKDQDLDEKLLKMKILGHKQPSQDTLTDTRLTSNPGPTSNPSPVKSFPKIQKESDTSPIITDLSPLLHFSPTVIISASPLFALPMAAPFHSLNSFPYKIKLSPEGPDHIKKSKLADEMFSQILHLKPSSIETSLMKNVIQSRSDSLLSVFLPHSKIVRKKS